jgi:Myb/SANT-like DNA-binding domain
MAEPVTVVKEATRVSWNDTNRRHFVNAMMNEAAKGTFVDNGFKKQSWHSIMLEFIVTSGCKYDKQQLHSHYGVLKKKYNIYNALINNSGFGVDPNNGGPTAADEVWSAYLKAHPDASEFRGKPFVLFEDLDSIFTGKVATGKYSKSSMTPSPAAIPREKRQRDSSGDESWLKGGNDEDANDESDDCSDDIPVRNAARAVAAPEKEVKPVPVRTVRPKPGSEIAGFLGKIVDNQERIVKHNMADSKLDQALKCFSAKYSDLDVMDRIKFKTVLSALPATSEMFLQMDDEERDAFIRQTVA